MTQTQESDESWAVEHHSAQGAQIVFYGTEREAVEFSRDRNRLGTVREFYYALPLSTARAAAS